MSTLAHDIAAELLSNLEERLATTLSELEENPLGEATVGVSVKLTYNPHDGLFAAVITDKQANITKRETFYRSQTAMRLDLDEEQR